VTMVVDPSNAMSYTAFGDKGQGQDNFGGAGARTLLMGDRFIEMERRFSYYECTQHDRKFFDFDGRPVNPRTMQPLMGSERAHWVPLRMRRPSTPVRLGKVIVDSFTNLLFGENRFPLVTVEGDAQTEDWLQTAVTLAKLPLKMIQARNYGGACGSVGMSWCFRDGRPHFEVHNAKNLFVHRWTDRMELIPEEVSELYLFSKVKWDGKGFNKLWYWFRRSWTPTADIIFKEVVYDQTKEPEWEVDEEKSTYHEDGFCHLHWIQNLPCEDQDGLPDFDGLYENFDQVDTLMSVITKGAILNLDPTLVLKVDPDLVNRMGVKKGSDNSLSVGEGGGAEYMELNGASLTAGLELVKELRRYIFETAQVVVPDPHEVAAQGVSSVAIKAMFGPMLAKADILREQYGTAVERMLNNMEVVARDKTQQTMMMQVPVQQIDPLTGQPETVMTEEPVQFQIILPPKVESRPLVDPLTGQDSGEDNTVQTPRTLGPGGELALKWPPYFPPTPQDQSQLVQALTTATGGKAFISQETATEVCAKAFNQDPSEEWEKVQAEAKQDQANQAMMTPGTGGEVAGPHDHPDATGGQPPHPMPNPTPHAPGGAPPPAADPDMDVPVDIDLSGM
jgi:hypothetical protein